MLAGGAGQAGLGAGAQGRGGVWVVGVRQSGREAPAAGGLGAGLAAGQAVGATKADSWAAVCGRRQSLLVCLQGKV